MLRSLGALSRIDLGFRPEGVLTLRLYLPEHAYPEATQVVQFYERLLDRVRHVPGVRHAGALRVLPLANTIGDWGLDVEGYVETPAATPRATGRWPPRVLSRRWASDSSGAAVHEADVADSAQVAVVNETMARRYWKDGNQSGSVSGWAAMPGVRGLRWSESCPTSATTVSRPT